MAGVITITLNPAIDHTIRLESLTPGGINRVVWQQKLAGGKGVNVSALLADYGVPSMASGFMGSANPEPFETLFRDKGILDGFVRVTGETRTGIKILDGTHGTTDINFPGLEPDGKAWDTLTGRLKDLAGPGGWFVFGGSLPPGVDTGRFRKLLEIPKNAGALVAADTSGEALAAAVDVGVDLIKPNEHELAEVTGVSARELVSDPSAVLDRMRGKVAHIILSMGARGARFSLPEGDYIADPVEIGVVGTVGAGDSLLSGYLAGLLTDRTPEDRVKLATIFAWSALEKVERFLPPAEEILRRMTLVNVRKADVTGG